MNSIEGYLKAYIDQIMEAADLAPRDTRRVRAELSDHLEEIVAISRRNNIPEREVMMMVEGEFGKPKELGEAIARARGRFRTYLKKRARRWPIEVAVALVLALGIKAFAMQTFRATTDTLSPVVLKGNRVLVNKLTSRLQENDVIVYRDGDYAKIGLVKDLNTSQDKVVISRNGEDEKTIDTDMITGRVVLQIR